MTRQDKTSTRQVQDKTRQDKKKTRKRQDKSRQDKTRQDRQDKTRQFKTRQDKIPLFSSRLSSFLLLFVLLARVRYLNA